MSTSLYRVENGNLFIADRAIDLPHPVIEVIECGEMIVVRVDPPAGTIFNRNVFAFTKHGELLWQIEESPHGTEKDKPYVAILRAQDGNLIAANWIGIDYLVNLANGNIAAKAFNK
jgi:hypothetical protein